MAEAKITIAPRPAGRATAFDVYARSIGADPGKLLRLMRMSVTGFLISREWSVRVGSNFWAPARSAARVRQLREARRLPWGRR